MKLLKTIIFSTLLIIISCKEKDNETPKLKEDGGSKIIKNDEATINLICSQNKNIPPEECKNNILLTFCSNQESDEDISEHCDVVKNEKNEEVGVINISGNTSCQNRTFVFTRDYFSYKAGDAISGSCNTDYTIKQNRICYNVELGLPLDAIMDKDAIRSQLKNYAKNNSDEDEISVFNTLFNYTAIVHGVCLNLETKELYVDPEKQAFLDDRE
jgi:hypothetical protein